MEVDRIVKVAAGGILAVMLAVIFKKEKEVFSVYINIIACVMILFWGLSKIDVILDTINKLQSHVKINPAYVGILIKIVGITYITEFSASLCKDSGYHAIGEQIELVGKLSILAISMPVMLALLDTISNFLST